MSPRKLTEDDKQEILQLYRNSEATTSTLANDYEVSSSTISRFLKNKLSSTEYEDLIQQKRLARTPRGEKSSVKTKPASPNKTKKTKAKSRSEKKPVKTEKVVAVEKTKSVEAVTTESETEFESEIKSEAKSSSRRRRRRSSTAAEANLVEASTPVLEANEPEEVVEEKPPSKLVIDKQLDGTTQVTENDNDVEELADSATSKSNSLILKADRLDFEEDEEDEEDEVDLIALKEMLGDDLDDFNDEEDEEDEDWDEDNDESITYSTKSSSLSDIEILPLSQASLPRTCYLVIDRSAELIVKPLADFADLGSIPQEEVKQRTLPIFDNHRIAKRFSHRRERVIKVPDGRMIQKTSHHLQDKGITRLLIDGQIYSLSH